MIFAAAFNDMVLSYLADCKDAICFNWGKFEFGPRPFTLLYSSFLSPSL